MYNTLQALNSNRNPEVDVMPRRSRENLVKRCLDPSLARRTITRLGTLDVLIF
jgi:hypothetical protein